MISGAPPRSATPTAKETRVRVEVLSKIQLSGKVNFVSSGLTIMDTVKNGIDAVGGKEKVLIVTADLPFLTAEAIDDFLLQDLTAMKANAYRVACENAWEVQEQKMLAAYQAIGFDSRNAQGVSQ